MAIYKVDGRAPQVGAAAFVADNATLAGDVTLAEESSVWYGAVLRADTGRITVGAGSNVQDNAVLHTGPGLDGMCPLATVPWCMGVPWGMIV